MANLENITPELAQKLTAAKSPEELGALLKENGYEVSENEAKLLFDNINAKIGELSDDDLENVSGGALVIFGVIKKLFGTTKTKK